MLVRRLLSAACALVVGGAALTLGSGSAAAAKDPLDVWVLGDSVALGWTGPTAATVTLKGLTDQQMYTPGGFRGFLDAELTQRGVAHRFIGTLTNNPPLVVRNQSDRHDGHKAFWVDLLNKGVDGPDDYPGYSGGDGLGHWLTGTKTRGPLDPDVIVLSIGVPDVVLHIDPKGDYPNGHYDPTDARQRQQFVSHLTDRFRALISKLHRLRPEAAIVLSTLIPIGGPGNTDPTVTAMNQAMLLRLVPEFTLAGVNIVLANVDGSVRAGRDRLAYDTFHPTAEGYAAIGRSLADSIQVARLLGAGS